VSDDDAGETKKSTEWVASMATEILSTGSATGDKAPTTMAEDVTIMAKGRRRRFRLR